MMIIPDELQNLFVMYSITNWEVVEVNRRKGRWNLSGYTKEGHHIFIKWNDKKNVLECSWLDRERSMYVMMDNSFSAKYYAEFPFVAIDYLEGCRTIRDEILSGTDKYKEILEIFAERYVQMYNYLQTRRQYFSLKNTDVRTVFFGDLKIFWGKLMYSGPVKTKKKNLEKMRNRIIKNWIGRFVIDKQFGAYQYSSLSVIHGDLHLGNIVLDNSNQVYIIDYENVKLGIAEFDLAYCYAQIYALQDGKQKDEKRTVLNEIMETILDKLSLDSSLFWNACRLYIMAITFNSRFRVDEKKAPFGDCVAVMKEYFKDWTM